MRFTREAAMLPTDATGNYRFKVSRTTELQLVFAKIGYQARPTVRRVFAEGAQPTVSLIKENASSAYYAELAKRFIQLPEASVESHARTIATLSPLDLAKVKQAVADESATQRLRTLEAAERETRAVSDWD